MKIKKLANGKYKLTAPNGVRDTRTDRVYTEAIVKEQDIQYYTAV